MFQQLSLAPNPQPDRHLKVFALCLTERDIAFVFFNERSFGFDKGLVFL